MINASTPVRFRDPLPEATDVVVVGGGVIGVFAALYLRRLGKDVVLCEKGRIAGEQSSRNWGWVRCQNRDLAELPLAMEAQQLWKAVDEEVKGATGLAQTGILQAFYTEKQMAKMHFWLEVAAQHGLDSRFITGAEVGEITGTGRAYAGGLHTPSDCRAEPWAAVPAVAGLVR